MNRPFGATLLALLAGLEALFGIYHALQYLHLLPSSISTGLGTFRFFGFDALGALLWGLAAVLWMWAALLLWTLDPRGWLLAVILSTLSLVLALVSIVGSSTVQAMLPSTLITGIALIYCLMPGTLAAFKAPAAK